MKGIGLLGWDFAAEMPAPEHRGTMALGEHLRISLCSKEAMDRGACLPTQDGFSFMFPRGLHRALLGSLLFAGTTPVLFVSLLTSAAIYHWSLCLNSWLWTDLPSVRPYSYSFWPCNMLPVELFESGNSFFHQGSVSAVLQFFWGKRESPGRVLVPFLPELLKLVKGYRPVTAILS